MYAVLFLLVLSVHALDACRDESRLLCSTVATDAVCFRFIDGDVCADDIQNGWLAWSDAQALTFAAHTIDVKGPCAPCVMLRDPIRAWNWTQFLEPLLACDCQVSTDDLCPRALQRQSATWGDDWFEFQTATACLSDQASRFRWSVTSAIMGVERDKPLVTLGSSVIIKSAYVKELSVSGVRFDDAEFLEFVNNFRYYTAMFEAAAMLLEVDAEVAIRKLRVPSLAEKRLSCINDATLKLKEKPSYVTENMDYLVDELC